MQSALVLVNLTTQSIRSIAKEVRFFIYKFREVQKVQQYVHKSYKFINKFSFFFFLLLVWCSRIFTKILTIEKKKRGSTGKVWKKVCLKSAMRLSGRNASTLPAIMDSVQHYLRSE